MWYLHYIVFIFTYLTGLEDNTLFKIYFQSGGLGLGDTPLSANQLMAYSLPSSYYYHITADKPIMIAHMAKGK